MHHDTHFTLVSLVLPNLVTDIYSFPNQNTYLCDLSAGFREIK